MNSVRTLASIRRKRPRGSTLLLVLWAIMLTSMAVVGLVKLVSRGLDESVDAEKDFRARLLLQSARNIASHPLITRGDPLLKQQLGPVTSYEITLTTEGSRIAINQIGSGLPQRNMTQRLFEQWGLDSSQARSLVESIADWTDTDDRPLPQGAERDVYLALEHPDYPWNRPFENLEEVLLVRGADAMEKVRPEWRDSFTLYGDGSIDVNTAPSGILEALFDVTPLEVSRLVRTRDGPDDTADTEDDVILGSMEEVRRVLDVPERQYRRASRILTLAHPIRRTECLARAGNLERRLILLNGPGLSLIREE